MMNIVMIHGPNTRLFDSRGEIYGKLSFDELVNECNSHADDLGMEIEHYSSNAEHELIEKVHTLINTCSGVIINAGGYTHTSIALADALEMLRCPVIEVHASNIFKREEFRHHSYISRIASGVICGMGLVSYLSAISALEKMLRTK